jgi:hypothetical protein
MVPGWIAWVLRNRPEAHVVHIVRHPGGYLNSLRKRMWSELDTAKVVQDNRDRLARVAASDPVWADQFGDLEALSAVEAELWYWRYAGETIHQAGEGNPRYHLVAYEELTRNPVGLSRALFRACGLDWDEAVEQAIERISEGSQAIAAAWREQLSGAEVRLIEQILRESPLRDLWYGNGDGDGDGDGAGSERIGIDPAVGTRDGALHSGPAQGGRP